MRIHITIEGKTPLLVKAFTDVDAEQSTSGTRMAAVGDRGTPREQAESRLYKGIKGDLIIPQPNLFRCLIDGGIYFKAGRSKVTTQKSSMIPACVELNGLDNAAEIPIDHKEPWTVDTRAVRIPSTGGRILCHRPMFQDWALSFEVVLDTTMMAPKLFRELVDAAGNRVGLGDFRPSCKGPFGRFNVVSWQVIEDQQEDDEVVDEKIA